YAGAVSPAGTREARMRELWPQLEPWLLAVWALYLLVLAGWIVLQKREPIATLSWLLSLAALPVLGLLIYHFFGPQRIRRQQLRRNRSRTGLEPALPAGLSASDDCVTLARLGQSATRYAPATATEAELLVGGHATYDALLAAIAGAQHHIHLEYYIFDPDPSGTAVRDALADAPAPACGYGCCWTRSARARPATASWRRCARPAPRSPGSIRCGCAGSGARG